ncbi:sensor domain-containing protein [Rhodococcus sp. D2-41]|uniref:sensor domain-containing protein n=1 Tax=Speluncibacter jeojiensis TaxID=2710754 RepID=UPI002410A683|nr:sensor domain-containing protein [Rhodococcus sp. D2-41]MDG3012010.1 sensor domain-containing protein [Rhodococcus sp. D2-41]
MNRRAATVGTAGLVAVLSTTLAACGGGAPAAPALPTLGPARTAPAPTAGPITDAAKLMTTVVAPEDLPPGFSELPGGDGTALVDPAAPSTTAGPDRSGTDPATCAKVLSPIADQSPGAVSRTAIHYTGPGLRSVDQDSASYPGVGARDAFAAAQHVLAGCTAYSGTDADGTHITYRLGGLDQPQSGDASTSFQLHATSAGTTLVFDVTILVVGATVTQIAASGTEPFDAAAMTRMSAAAADHLRAAGQ